MITIDVAKKNQRKSSAITRDIQKLNNTKAPFKLANQILKIEDFRKAKIVASFISIKSEISMDPINNFLISSNKKISLPVVWKKNQHLIFRKFDNDTIFKQGKYGILEPDERSKELLPDFILTPCLAFDKFGYRLGYGGGYYDRTIVKYRKLGHSFITVAVAFDIQIVDKIVKNEYDQKIDYILTEKKIYSSK
jgi:5-formyltetrahydrofolate cyclo-ligase